MVGLAVVLVPHEVVNSDCLIGVAVTVLRALSGLRFPDVGLGSLANLLSLFP